MRTPTDIVRAVRQTEKGGRIARHGQFVLEVARDANKIEIRQAVETLFKVNVTRVNTRTTHGKTRRLAGRVGRRPDRKHAIVTLAKGQKIEVKA